MHIFSAVFEYFLAKITLSASAVPSCFPLFTFFVSVSDPEPDPDPYFFGPPGSGSRSVIIFYVSERSFMYVTVSC